MHGQKKERKEQQDDETCTHQKGRNPNFYWPCIRILISSHLARYNNPRV